MKEYKGKKEYKERKGKDYQERKHKTTQLKFLNLGEFIVQKSVKKV